MPRDVEKSQTLLRWEKTVVIGMQWAVVWAGSRDLAAARANTYTARRGKRTGRGRGHLSGWNPLFENFISPQDGEKRDVEKVTQIST